MTTRVIAVSLLAIFPSLSAFGQPAPHPPAFEVADIKVNTSKDPRPGKERLLPGGRIEVPNATLREMIRAAYGVQPNMITGGPNWLDSERFDMVAKAPPETPLPTLLLMLRTLLEERFKLAFHREDKVMPAYALVVGKGGPKLHQTAAGGRQNCNSSLVDKGGIRMLHRECHNMTLEEFARQLPGLGGAGIDRPVVDMTELTGAYDFEFDYAPQMSGRGDDNRGGGDGPSAADSAGPSISDAMTQLGLKLEASKRPMSCIVIDRAEKPTEN